MLALLTISTCTALRRFSLGFLWSSGTVAYKTIKNTRPRHVTCWRCWQIRLALLFGDFHLAFSEAQCYHMQSRQWYQSCSLCIYVYFFSFTACWLPCPLVEYLGSCTGKALPDQRLAITVRVDMEERTDAPNWQLTSSPACNLWFRHSYVAVLR